VTMNLVGKNAQLEEEEQQLQQQPTRLGVVPVTDLIVVSVIPYTGLANNVTESRLVP